jgi:lipopolysaccharide export system permease protein
MKPLVILSLVISLGAFMFSNYILPIANLKFHSLLYDVRQKKLALNIKEGIFYNGIDGFTIRIGNKDQENNIIRDVMIYNHTKRQGNTQVTVAEWGKMELAPDKSTLIFTLYDGYNYEEVTDRKDYKVSRPFQRVKFKEQVKRFGGLNMGMNRTDESLFRKNYQMMNLIQLESSKDSLVEELKLKVDRFDKSIKDKYVFYYQIDSMINLPDTMFIQPDTMISEPDLTIRQLDTTTNLNDTMIGQFATITNQHDTLAIDSAWLFYDMDKTEKLKAIDFAMQSSRAIKNNIENSKADFEKREERIRKHEIEWHRKFTLSIACFILFFIGAPLGAIIRKGGLGMPVVVSIFFFVIFHIISITGEKYARAGLMEPYLAMWLASAVLLPIGIFLTYKATTDSPLLDSDSWKKLSKLFTIAKKENGTMTK